VETGLFEEKQQKNEAF